MGSRKADLFCVCLSHGLSTYVQEEIKSSNYKPKERTGRPLLQFLFDLCRLHAKLPDLEELRLLLEQGAQPNEEYAGQTSWHYALEATQFVVMNFPEPKGWTSLLLLLVEYGADPNLPVNRNLECTPLEDISYMVFPSTWEWNGVK